MYTYSLKSEALNDLKKLPKDIQKKIVDKIDYYVSSSMPLSFAKRLVKSEAGQYRFRIGDYRVVFDLEGKEIIILVIDHRKDIYK